MTVAEARMSTSDELRGKTALITGAGRGLGAATASRLAAAGAHIIVADIDAGLAHSSATTLNDRHGSGTAHSIELDVRDTAAIESLSRQLPDGRLDILVNNAGTDRTASVQDLRPAEWDRVIGTNLTGPFLLSRWAFGVMPRGGNIVNIVSTAAKRAWANASAYHASKWGLLGLSHALHVEGRERGIGVTAVIAGGMRTPFLLDRFPDIDQSTLQDPSAVADAVFFAVTRPPGTVVAELSVLPVGETSWP
jgi:NAD(P)-dependent dehydrogenase (short-subunit alcohol dehydrogenase family)